MPILNNPAITDPKYVDCGEPHRPTGRRVSHELAFVSTGEDEASGDFVAAHQKVLDLAMEVGYCPSKGLRSEKQAFGTLRSSFRQRIVMKQVVHRGSCVPRVSCIPERIKQTCGL